LRGDWPEVLGGRNSTGGGRGGAQDNFKEKIREIEMKYNNELFGDIN
jgi:hypothetical protein